MNWLSKAILYWGNTINTSLGYEIYKEMAASNFCEDCYVPEKARNMLDTELITDLICNGCKCSLSTK